MISTFEEIEEGMCLAVLSGKTVFLRSKITNIDYQFKSFTAFRNRVLIVSDEYDVKIVPKDKLSEYTIVIK